MGFAGELSTIGLPDVFSNVAFGRLTGILTVTERDRQVRVYFEDGLIRAFASSPERSLDYAVLALRANAAPVQAVRDAGRRRRRRTLKEILRDAEGFDEERYDAAISTAIREELIVLFGWRRAAFVFDEVRPAEGDFDREQMGCRISIDPQAVIVEAARRADEWDAIAHRIGSDRDVFIAVGGPPAEHASPAMQRLLDRLDGTRDLKALIEEMPHGRFHVLKMVTDLLDQGLLQKASADQLRSLAEQAEAAADFHRAAAHLEAVLELDGGDAETRRALIGLYERGGRRSDAAREHKRLARAHEQSGDLDGALACFEQAAELAPYDLETLERIVEIHDARGDQELFMRAGLRLAEALSSQRLHEEARDVYRRLLEHDGESVLLHEALAATYVKLHEPQKAARELFGLAARAMDRGDGARALHYYRSVLAVDRDSAEAASRIAELESSRIRARRRRIRHRILSVVFTLLLGAGAWWGVREWNARGALHAASRAALAGLVARPPEEALAEAVEAYATVTRDYPGTTAAEEASETVRFLLTDALWRLRRYDAHEAETADRLLTRLNRTQLPDDLKDFWKEARERLLDQMARKRE